jgi:hypothetical protein
MPPQHWLSSALAWRRTSLLTIGVHVRLKGVDAAEMNSPLGQAARESEKTGT